jgi:hypothetical protein
MTMIMIMMMMTITVVMVVMLMVVVMININLLTRIFAGNIMYLNPAAIYSFQFQLAYLFKCGPGSSVGISTDYGLDGPGSNPGGSEIFRTMGTGSFPGVKRPGRGVDHPPPPSAEIENE